MKRDAQTGSSQGARARIVELVEDSRVGAMYTQSVASIRMRKAPLWERLPCARSTADTQWQIEPDHWRVRPYLRVRKLQALEYPLVPLVFDALTCQ